jgi:hypothetical protein
MAAELLRYLPVKKRLWMFTAAYVALSFPVAFWLLPTGREAPPAFAAPRQEPAWHLDATRGKPIRDLALREARVWNPVDAAAADLSANPPDPSGALSQSIVRCKYISEPARGTTPKFDCALADGEVVKVKYGRTGEIHAELAATRLLTALGFGADRMYLVPRVRCYGCMRTPFYTVWALDYVKMRDTVMRTVPPDSYTDFEWAAVERHFEGTPIEDGDESGWAWFEFDEVDPAHGANRAERDALRLAAMLLAHWDNKADNQRLVCRDAAASPDAPCPKPFALIHDLGATFGPNKMDLDAWSSAPIWHDRAACSVSMKSFPYHGATFRDTQISEAGRQLLLRQLNALTDAQLNALFKAARFPEFFGGHGKSADPSAWTQALRQKIQQIADGSPCPDSAKTTSTE